MQSLALQEEPTESWCTAFRRTLDHDPLKKARLLEVPLRRGAAAWSRGVPTGALGVQNWGGWGFSGV